MLNADMLKGKIVENKLTYEDCANELSISKNSFNSKINNKTKSGFGITEVARLSEFLRLSDREKLAIFFDFKIDSE